MTNLALDDYEQLPGLIHLKAKHFSVRVRVITESKAFFFTRRATKTQCSITVSQKATCIMTTANAIAHNGALTTALKKMPVLSK